MQFTVFLFLDIFFVRLSLITIGESLSVAPRRLEQMVRAFVYVSYSKDHKILKKIPFIYFFEGRPFFHLMRESIIPFYQCYQLVHGSPYLPKVNKLLRYLQEGGILDFWWRNTIYSAINEGLLVPNEDYEDVPFVPKMLDLERFYFAFFILIIGCAIAGIVFVLEIICKCVEDCNSSAIHPFTN